MDSDKLLDCPFCGSEPKVNKYPTFIKIFCAECTKVNRNVEVFGDGHYSEWARQQTADKNGMIRIAAELNPVSNTEAFATLAEIWNDRR